MKWQPTPVVLPGKSHGERNLVGDSPRGHREWNMTERLSTHWEMGAEVSNHLSLFSRPVVLDSLWPHGLQHGRSPCPSPSPEVFPSSYSLHQWCHSAFSSDALFSFCPPSFPASGTCQMSQLFTSDDQNTGPSASVLLTSIQCWFPLRLTTWISLLSKGLSEVFSNTTVWQHLFFALHLLYSPALTTICDHRKDRGLTIWTFVSRVMSLLFSTLSIYVMAFLPRSNHLLISWLQSPSAMILEPKKRKSITTFTFSPNHKNGFIFQSF